MWWMIMSSAVSISSSWLSLCLRSWSAFWFVFSLVWVSRKLTQMSWLGVTNITCCPEFTVLSCRSPHQLTQLHRWSVQRRYYYPRQHQGRRAVLTQVYVIVICQSGLCCFYHTMLQQLQQIVWKLILKVLILIKFGFAILDLLSN